MCRKLVAVCVLALALTFAVGAGKAHAAEPFPEEATVVAVDAPAVEVAPAVEAAPSSGVAVEAEASKPPWWLELAQGILLSVFALVSSLFFGYVGKKVHDNAVLQEANRALETGVNKSWVDIVRDLKHKAGDADGFTASDKKEALAYAIDVAKREAGGAAKKLLESLGKSALESIVSKIVRKRKSEG